jgi:hypothetical protein
LFRISVVLEKAGIFIKSFPLFNDQFPSKHTCHNDSLTNLLCLIVARLIDPQGKQKNATLKHSLLREFGRQRNQETECKIIS